MGIKEKIKNAPETSGVYLMRDTSGEVIYIGKAKSLKSRLTSYLSKSLSAKTAALMSHVADVEYITCVAESMALLFEANLIRQYKPKYNVVLRDDKSYPYIEITAEAYPRIFISRPKGAAHGLLFGPYPKTKTLKSALGLIRQIFPYRSCANMPKTPCLFFHLNLCPAPCIGRISEAGYKETIDNIAKLLRAQVKELAEKLELTMTQLSRARQFEEAALVRDQVTSLQNLYLGRAKTHELETLKDLLGLAHIPLAIDAVDISSLQGGLAVGSIVVFKNGRPDKNNYRKFRIKEIRGVDDYAMMREVIRRRFSRLRDEKKKFPDLLLIDGGLGHVQSVKEELERLDVHIPLVGLAKENEELWLPEAAKPLVLSRDNEALKLLQRIRDEAHRFAHKYHLWRRKNNLLKN